MNSLLPQFGIVIMFGYALFNLYNILLLRIDFPYTIVWLLSASAVYFIYRIHQMLQTNKGLTRSELTGYILIGLSFASLALQYLNLQEYAGEDGVFMLQNLRTDWTLSMLWLFAGGAAAMWNAKESPTRAIVVLVLTGLAFVNGLDEQMMVSYYDVKELGVVERVSHLSMEKHVIFLLILAYSLSPKTKWLVVLTGMAMLFTMGGRTSLVVFATCVIGMNIGRRSLKNFAILGILGWVLFFSLRYSIENQIINIDHPQVNDMLFLDGLEEDSSFIARQLLFETSLQYLDDQFLFGDPTIISEIFGTQGGYIHNILSVWQFYGFFVFACVVLILFFSLRRMVVLKTINPTPKIIFGSFFLMYVSISVILAKSVGWDLLWFMLGFWTLLPLTETRRRNKRYLHRY